MCAALRNADAEISERTLRLDYGWLRWSHQLNFLQQVEHMMDEDHRELYVQILHVFLSKLKAVLAMLRRLVVPDMKPVPGDSGSCSGTNRTVTAATGTVGYAPRRVKYALNKTSLDKAIEELEMWQRTADQSWFLLMKMASQQIDAAIVGGHGGSASIATTVPSVLALRASSHHGGRTPSAPMPGITLPAEELGRMLISPIPFCDARLAERVDGSRSTYVLVGIACPDPAKYQLVKKDTRDLARRLQHNEPQTFGLLSCKGFVVEQTPSSLDPGPQVTFTMVFRAPFPSASPPRPRSLRDLLLNGPRPSSLSTRFEIARELAKSVSYVHSFGFVHKNIRPESVLRFVDGHMERRDSAGAAYCCLVGFDSFRREDGRTQRRGDDAPDCNLYRHPSRQGSSPREDYIMQHDIYSLGVCLLEVGLWSSFVEYRQDGQQQSAAVRVLSPALGLPVHAPDPYDTAAASRFLETAGKDHMVALARDRLPGCMGSKYAEIVETCLTCLDPGNADFGDAREFEDDGGIRVGVRYIEKVKFPLATLGSELGG